MGSKVFRDVYLQRAGEQACEPVECPECEQACRPWCPRVRRITTVCGVIRVERWVYRLRRVITMCRGKLWSIHTSRC